MAMSLTVLASFPGSSHMRAWERGYDCIACNCHLYLGHTRLIYTVKNTTEIHDQSYLVIIVFLLGLHHNNTVGEVGNYLSLGNYVFISKLRVLVVGIHLGVPQPICRHCI